MAPETDPSAARENGVDEKVRQRLESFIPDLLRRTLYAGLGAVVASEDGIRRLANEFSLPKDAARNLIGQAQATKDELFRSIAGEVRAFLEQVNISEELTRMLTALSFEVKTEVRFVPNDPKGLRPKVAQKVSVKRAEPRRKAKAPRQRRRAATPRTRRE